MAKPKPATFEHGLDPAAPRAKRIGSLVAKGNS
jgi:hypothetical protein